MFARALLAFLALPGVAAFLVPALWLRITGHTTLAHPFGVVLLVAGVAALLACVRDFYVAGRGTLAPWAPPRYLVRVGLYRYTRNPMYVSVVTIVVGWSVAFASTGLLLYAVAMAIAFHVRVVRNEEPFLAGTQGEDWQRYRREVPRWLR
jgi:protein-S-isoprenylcysteine O-methyltransferase Ste14